MELAGLRELKDGEADLPGFLAEILSAIQTPVAYSHFRILLHINGGLCSRACSQRFSSGRDQQQRFQHWRQIHDVV